MFSTTRHERIGERHSFSQSNGESHLTYPNFTIARDIPAGCDMKIELEPMDDGDWDLPNHLCDGGGNADCNFSNFEERLAFVNRVFNLRHAGRPMTRAQCKKASDEIKSALGLQNEPNRPHHVMDPPARKMTPRLCSQIEQK